MTDNIMTRDEVEALDGHTPGPWTEIGYVSPNAAPLIAAAPALKATALALHEKVEKLKGTLAARNAGQIEAEKIIEEQDNQLELLEAENVRLQNELNRRVTGELKNAEEPTESESRGSSSFGPERIQEARKLCQVLSRSHYKTPLALSYLTEALDEIERLQKRQVRTERVKSGYIRCKGCNRLWHYAKGDVACPGCGGEITEESDHEQ